MEDVYDVFNTRRRLESLIGRYHKMGAKEKYGKPKYQAIVSPKTKKPFLISLGRIDGRNYQSPENVIRSDLRRLRQGMETLG